MVPYRLLLCGGGRDEVKGKTMLWSGCMLAFSVEWKLVLFVLITVI